MSSCFINSLASGKNSFKKLNIFSLAIYSRIQLINHQMGGVVCPKVRPMSSACLTCWPRPGSLKRRSREKPKSRMPPSPSLSPESPNPSESGTPSGLMEMALARGRRRNTTKGIALVKKTKKTPWGSKGIFHATKS